MEKSDVCFRKERGWYRLRSEGVRVSALECLPCHRAIAMAAIHACLFALSNFFHHPVAAALKTSSPMVFSPCRRALLVEGFSQNHLLCAHLSLSKAPHQLYPTEPTASAQWAGSRRALFPAHSQAAR